MARKPVSNRQKRSFRIEPSQRALKPRNPVAIAAKQRAAGPHRKSNAANRQAKKRELIRVLRQNNHGD